MINYSWGEASVASRVKRARGKAVPSRDEDEGRLWAPTNQEKAHWDAILCGPCITTLKPVEEENIAKLRNYPDNMILNGISSWTVLVIMTVIDKYFGGQFHSWQWLAQPI